MPSQPQHSFREDTVPDSWWAVNTIAAGTFLLVTAEFLPIGLLSKLAADLKVSEGTAGLAVTAPGLVAALAAPVLILLVGRTDRRLVIAALTAAVVASCAISASAGSFSVFLLGRLVLGLAVGGLWTFAVAVGRRLVAESSGARATAVISAGISAGTIFGMPVGAGLGEWIGWRSIFGATAVLGVVIVLAQLRFLPRLAVKSAIDTARLLSFARVPMARMGLLVSGLVAAGHFVGYTFLEPFLRSVLRGDRVGVSLALAGYAIAGIIGSFLGERFAVLDVRRALAAASALIGVTTLAAATLQGTALGSISMVMMWGLAFGAVPVCVQIWMFTSSPTLYEAGSALMVSAFQISLAAGAALGGTLVDHFGIVSAFVASAVVTLGGAATALLFNPSSADPGGEDLQAEKQV